MPYRVPCPRQASNSVRRCKRRIISNTQLPKKGYYFFEDMRIYRIRLKKFRESEGDHFPIVG
jgi:hypothetical protein